VRAAALSLLRRWQHSRTGVKKIFAVAVVTLGSLKQRPASLRKRHVFFALAPFILPRETVQDVRG